VSLGKEIERIFTRTEFLIVVDFNCTASVPEMFEAMRLDSTNYYPLGTPMILTSFHETNRRGRYSFRGDQEALLKGYKMTILKAWKVGHG